MRAVLRSGRILSLVLAVVLTGCGGGAAAYYGGDTAGAAPGSGTVTHGPMPAAAPMEADSYADEDGVMLEAEEISAAQSTGSAQGGEGGVGWRAFDDSRTDQEMRNRRQLLAQAPRRREPPTPPPDPQPTTPDPDDPQTTTDAAEGPLLIYQAVLNLAVYQVEENQRSVIQVAEELGGYLSRQDDQVVVIRIPASKFRDAVARIEALGDVLHRNIQALDVSEEFRDAQIRLRNAENVRDRLAALLEQARNVEESLQIERELERITREIELLKGRLRYLEDRIAYSTITVNFSPKEEESLEGEIFHLPFDFLYELGLRRLMNLR